MSKIKNIAVISTSLNSGGAERIAGLLSKKLASKYNVYLFLLSTDNIVYEYGGTIIDIGKEMSFYEHSIRSAKEKYDIDISISFLEIMNFANIRTKGKDKVIISERCVQSLFQPSLDAQTYKIKKYYNYADGIVACSYGVKHDLISNYSVNNVIKVIYNFINQDRILELAQCELDAEIKGFVGEEEFFLNVGRLHPQKNQVAIIETFAKFVETNKNYKLLILGSGELEEDLNHLINNKGLSDFVKVIPYDPNPYRYMSRAKGMILASKFEGLPNAILEAMTVKCPIIATDCLAGPRELLGRIKDYAEVIDNNIHIMDRGVILPFYNNNNNLNVNLLLESMHIIDKDSDLINSIKANQKKYMDEYNNEQILDEWIEFIKNTDRKDDVFDIENEIDEAKKTFIYGCGMIGTAYYLALKEIMNIDGFVVTENKQCLSEYMGIPVYEVNNVPYSKDEVQFIIGTIESTQDEIIRSINCNGFKNIIEPYIVPNNESLNFLRNYFNK